VSRLRHYMMESDASQLSIQALSAPEKNAGRPGRNRDAH
jgi:hypothetical protein